MAEFNAGTIKSTADLDNRPFLKKLKETEKRGEAFDKKTYTATLDFATKKAMADLKALQDRARKLSGGKATVGIDTGKAVKDLASISQRIQRLVKGSPYTVQLQVRSDDAAINALRTKLLGVDGKTAVVDVNADTAQAIAALSGVQAAADRVDADTVEIPVRADTTQAQGQLIAVQSAIDRVDGDTARVQVTADTAAARAQMAATEGAARRLGQQRPNIRVGTGNMMQAVAIIGAIIGALAGIPGAAAAAAAALAAIPAALTGALQIVGALGMGLSGIGGAYSAMGQAATKSGGAAAASGKKSEAAANGVKSAVRGLEAAQQQQARTAVQNAWAIADAERAVADARRQAARAIEDANRQVERSQRALIRAQDDLTRAWEQGREELEDLQLTLEGTGLSEERAAIALEKARARLEEGMASGASGIEAWELNLDFREADLQLRTVQERMGDLRTEQAVFDREGIAGSQAVKSAKEGLLSAEEALGDAVRARQQAEEDGARQIAEAEMQLGRARTQAQWASEDAARAVADAQDALADALKAQGEAGAAAAPGVDALAQAMDKLSPAGRRFVNFLYNEWRPAWEAIGHAVAEEMLPRLETGMRTFMGLFPEIQTALVGTGIVIGDLAIEAANMMTSGPFRADFAALTASNNRALMSLGRAGVDLTEAFFSVGAAAAPIVERFTRSAEASADLFNRWIEGKQASGELNQYLERGAQVLSTLWDIVKQVGSALWDMGVSLSPLAPLFMELLPPTLDVARALAQLIGAGLLVIGPIIVPIAESIGALARAFMMLPEPIQAVLGAVALFMGARGLLGLGGAATAAAADVGKVGTAATGLKGVISRLGPLAIALSLVDLATGGSFTAALSALPEQINNALTGEAMSATTLQWEAQFGRISNSVRTAMGLSTLYSQDGMMKIETSFADGFENVQRAVTLGLIPIPPQVEAAGQQAKERFMGVLAGMPPAARTSADGIARAIREALIPAIPQSASEAVNMLHDNLIATALGRGPDLRVTGDAIAFGLTAPLQGLPGAGAAAGAGTTAGLAGGLAPAPGVAGGAGQGAANNFGAGAGQLPGLGQSAGQGATDNMFGGLAGMPGNTGAQANDAAGRFGAGVGVMPGDGRRAGDGATAGVNDGLRPLPQDAANAGTGAGRGFFDGLIGWLKSAWESAMSWIGRIRDVMNSIGTLGMGGPRNPLGFADGGLVGYATGGTVRDTRQTRGYATGAGGSASIAASDTVPAMLTPGEFVVQKKAVQAVGVQSLDAINSLGAPGPSGTRSGGGVGYADGGAVTPLGEAIDTGIAAPTSPGPPGTGSIRQERRWTELVDGLLASSASMGSPTVLTDRTTAAIADAVRGSDGGARDVALLRTELMEVLERVTDAIDELARKPQIVVNPSEQMDESKIGRIAAEKSTFYAGVMG